MCRKTPAGVQCTGCYTIANKFPQTRLMVITLLTIQHSVPLTRKKKLLMPVPWSINLLLQSSVFSMSGNGFAISLLISTSNVSSQIFNSHISNKNSGCVKHHNFNSLLSLKWRSFLTFSNTVAIQSCNWRNWMINTITLKHLLWSV